MPRYEFERATPANALFERLKEEWDQQLTGEEAPRELYEPMMDHAGGIAAENPQDGRYGIFVVVRYGDDGRAEAYEGLVHVNHMLPLTSAATLRLIWNLVAPRYAYEDSPSPEDLGMVLSTFLSGALQLSVTSMPAREVKMYLANAMDRAFARLMVNNLGTQLPQFEFAIRAGWLHIVRVP